MSVLRFRSESNLTEKLHPSVFMTFVMRQRMFFVVEWI